MKTVSTKMFAFALRPRILFGPPVFSYFFHLYLSIPLHDPSKTWGSYFFRVPPKILRPPPTTTTGCIISLLEMLRACIFSSWEVKRVFYRSIQNIWHCSYHFNYSQINKIMRVYMNMCTHMIVYLRFTRGMLGVNWSDTGSLHCGDLRSVKWQLHGPGGF